MATKKPELVYGGPYAQESDAITLESSKEKPDYAQLITGWKTISQGARDYIASLEKPEKVEDGPFVENVVIEKEDTTKVKGQTEVDLDDL